MTVNYSVTFEFASRQPLTHRGQVTATTAATCMARAVREAKTALRPHTWSSLVCVLLDRVDVAGEPENADTDDAQDAGDVS